jgi:hypothetical protein
MSEQAPSKESSICGICGEHANEHLAIPGHQFHPGPFVVADGGGTGENRFRTMTDGFSAWTLDIDEALQFARRKDAEAYCAEDDDAWQILPVPRAAHESVRVGHFPSDVEKIVKAAQRT